MGNDKKQVEHLWSILIGTHPDAHSYDADEVADKLAQFGETTATIVLRDVRAAVQFTHDDFGKDGYRDDANGDAVIPVQDRKSLIAELENGWKDTTGESILGWSEEPYEESDLSWREPWLDHDRLGGVANVFRTRMMLEEIGGTAARRATCLLNLADIPFDTVNLKDTSSLAAVLFGDNAEAAVTAAYALGKIGPEAVDPLLAALSSEAVLLNDGVERGRTFQTVRSATVRALKRIGDRRALDTLMDAIGKFDDWTTEAALEAVVALGGNPRAVLPILQASLPVEDKVRQP